MQSPPGVPVESTVVHWSPGAPSPHGLRWTPLESRKSPYGVPMESCFYI